MRVKIEQYDGVKGKGVYSARGLNNLFTYKQFEGEKLIPPGSYADLIDGILYAITLPWYVKLWLKIMEVFNGYRGK